MGPVDLVATMATGAGKTDFYCVLMLSLKTQTLPWLERRFPINPCISIYVDWLALIILGDMEEFEDSCFLDRANRSEDN